MATPTNEPRPITAAALYLRENFQPDDRIAIVLINREKDTVLQRVPVMLEKAASPAYQSWLRYENAHGSDVYVSMNAMRADATGRTKADVAAIRHVYLDFDEGGRERVDQLLNRGVDDIPKPNYVLESSPGRFQVIWKVKDMPIGRAEDLLRGLARDADADPAVTDAARVLRLPGYRNWKYAESHFVKVEPIARGIARDAAEFPERLYELGRGLAPLPAKERQPGHYGGSQSERDFGYAIRQLKAGEDPERVQSAIAEYRIARGDKAYPHKYAERTVEKARQIVERERNATRGR
jgi:RepB DNA-primase N-terminal domain